jgi:hypothetical protein
MNTLLIILISFFTLVTIIQIFDIYIENLPDCWIIRYSNPITQVRYEKIFPKTTSET